MKTVIYRNYNDACPYCHVGRDDPFASCINPVVYSLFGSKNHWVVNCDSCQYREVVHEDFKYKIALLGIKFESENGNGIKRHTE